MQPMKRNSRQGRPPMPPRRRPSRRPALEALEDRVVLSYYTVTGFADGVDAARHGGNGTSASPYQETSLRGAVIAANGDPGSTIVLPAGHYTLSLGGHSDNNSAGQISVTAAITIQGAGSGSTIIDGGTGANNIGDKLFSFNPLGNTTGFPVTLTGLTLENGFNKVTNFNTEPNGGAFDFDSGFGSKFSTQGTLTMNDVIVTGNQTTDGYGGGIALYDGGTISITNCTFSSNLANNNGPRSAQQGGGIWIGNSEGHATSVTITGTTITGNNAAGGVGGGLFSAVAGSNSSVKLSGDTITNNTAASNGGGIADQGDGTDPWTINGGTVINNNSTNGFGGGIYGGGAETITNTTIDGNSAGTGGGGVYDEGLSITITDSRIVGNTSTSGGTAADENSGNSGGVSLNVSDNWFGTNTPPASFFGSGVVSSPYLVMTFTDATATVLPGQTDALTASVTTDSAGRTGYSIPNGDPVIFAASHGIDNPSTTATVNGSASTTYTPNAGYGGSDTLTATIDNQTLTLNITDDQAPAVTTNPSSQTVNAGQSVTFTAAASGTPAPTVQWQVSTNGGSSFSNISGATSTSYTFTATAAQNGNEYRAVFTNSVGSATTSAATLTVNTAPVVTTNPTSKTAGVNQTVTFTAAASGTPAPTVQWQVSTNGGSSFSNIFGATSTSYTFTATTNQNGYEYRAVFTNAAGTATTTAATLTVVSAPTANNQSVSVAFNTATPITLTGSDPNTPQQPLTYSIATAPAHGTISGFNSSTGTLTYTPNAGYHGSDSFTFTDNNGTYTSNTATVSITVSAGTPTADSQTVSVAHDSTGTPITLTGSDPDSPPLSLTYTVTTLPSHGTLSGTAPNLIYTPAAGYHGTDSFTFTDSNGVKTSSSATVTLNVAVGTPTANAQTVSTNQDTSHAITLTGSDDDNPALPLTYSIATAPAHGTISGFNSSTGTLTYTPSAGYSGSDSFQFTVSNGTNTSTPATVSISVASAQTAPTITGQPASETVTAGQTASFTASATGNPAPTVQWQVSTDGGSTFTDIAGATSTTYSFTASIGQSGNEYRAVFTNAAGSATTNAATLTVQQATIASTVGVAWGTAGTATLQTNSDGVRLLPAGRNTDMPWLGINRLTITLSSPETLTASDVHVTGVNVADYGPVTITGSGTTYTITLGQPINAADRVTVTVGNANIASFTRRLDVLPGDVNDDGVVNSQDAVIERNAYLGYGTVTIPLVFLDINGDGVVDSTDYGLVHNRAGTHLP